MRALVTGATGFVGRRLVSRLSQPVVLSRDANQAKAKLSVEEAHAWRPESEVPPPEGFRDVDCVFHLAGEPVADRRWNPEKKRRIHDSRVLGTWNLVRALAELETRPRVLVAASAVGFYGSRGDEILEETSSAGNDFLANVCREWEQASSAAAELGIRVVQCRIGVVLGMGGGAISKMLTPFKLGLGGRLGNGRQWMPWIHIDDVVGLLMYAAKSEQIAGPMNVVSPQPATNHDFTKSLAKVLRRPAMFPVPGFALKLLVGEFGQILLDSSRVVPRVAERTGFVFEFPELTGALANLLR